MKRILIGTAVLAVACCLLTQAAVAQEKKDAAAPDEKAIQEAMIKAATPGEQHKKLDPLVGTWDLTVQMFMDPSKPPTQSKGTAEIKWIMGNRFLEETIKGDFGGMEFNGRNVLGFDNLRKKYTSNWICTMCTSQTSGVGEMSTDGKTLTMLSEGIDPLTGQPMKGKDVLKIVDNDKLEATMYKLVGGQEVKAMHVTYTRKK
jgi:Protein of unknown function (DUF1579)